MTASPNPRRPQDRVRAILTSRLDSSSKLVALAIADHMNSADDEVWPSVIRLVSHTGLAERTVRDVLRGGRLAGWLSVTERVGDSSLLRISWATLRDVAPDRTSGQRKVGKGRTPTPAPGAVPHDDTPAPRATPPLRPVQATPAPRATGSLIAKTALFDSSYAGNGENGPLRPVPPKHEATNEATNEATILSATADAASPAPEKRKSVRKTKAPKEPHPFADRVYKAWDRVWEKRAGTGESYRWNYPVERAILTKCVADPYVSRDPAKADEDMQRVGAAMTRYLSQEVDGRFVKGLSIQGFAGNVAQWFTAVDATLSVRRAPAEHRSISDILGESESPPPLTPNRDAIDVAYRVIT